MATTTRTRRTRTTTRRWTARRFHQLAAAVIRNAVTRAAARRALEEIGASQRMIEAMELASARRGLRLLSDAGLALERYQELLSRYGAGLAPLGAR
jgi:hypothetical protein